MSNNTENNQDLLVAFYENEHTEEIEAEVCWPGEKPLRADQAIQIIKVKVCEELKSSLPNFRHLDELLQFDNRIAHIIEDVAMAVRNATLEKKKRTKR